jgi:hypothetical protein
MRESIGRHLDVVVVVWVLALAMSFSLVAIVRTPPADGQWSTTTTTQVHDGPFWDYPVTDVTH